MSSNRKPRVVGHGRLHHRFIGDSDEGFRVEMSAGGIREHIESTEVCVDLRGGKDASMMNGKSMIRKDGVVSWGQWQLERVSRPR